MSMRNLAAVALALALLGPLHAAEKPKKGTRSEPGSPAPAPAVSLAASRLEAFKARSIGPAVMGGRISEIALDPSDPFRYYLAMATGGIFRTSNAGVTFTPIFEKESVASMGALAVAPSNPKVLWAGSGEANDRNSSGWGNGVYRSTDRGETWSHAGLRESHAIARIVVKPTDPDTAWIAAAGDLWKPGGERGLYRTTDGGKSWTLVLSAAGPEASKVGCGDVALDGANPDTLYAALYARQRTPWSFTFGAAFTGGKDLGGIFKSTDGGTTWRKLEKGLPSLTGRIGLDVSRRDPRVVMAIVQSDEGGSTPLRDNRSKRGGVFRSEDAGETWTRMSPLNPRPFYFSQIRLDPVNDRRVYVLGVGLHVSEDGGATWREDLFEKVHADNHALAIYPEELKAEPDAKAPKSCRRLLLGTDGGLYQSFDAGASWDHRSNFAAGEFYRIAVDGRSPYRIAGGLQDNLNWLGPSRTFTKDGIVNSDWVNLGGGDGFYCVFDPDDADVVFAESQQGFVHRINLRTGELRRLRPEPAEGQRAFRYHWSAPLIPSHHARGVMYLAGNRVFRLSNRGEEWQVISPDLSTRDVDRITSVGSGAENYGVVYTLAESPIEKGLLWAGTDDGKLWRTDDDGASWVDLTASLPAAAKGQWMSRVEPSAHDRKVLYLAVDAHRDGNDAPLLYRTADSGLTWALLSANLPKNSPVKVIREDPRNPSLLFAGTEHGLFVSFERGAAWTRFGGLPTVAVDDLVIHPRESDLVIATHGRSLYIVDDLSPLRDVTAELLSKDAHLFPPKPAFGRELLAGWEGSAGKGAFRGKNPPEGATFTFYLKEPGAEPKISISNAAGQPVAELKPAGRPGFNRVTWDLKRGKEFSLDSGGDARGKFVKSGEYSVTLTVGTRKLKEKLVVTIAEGLETH